MRLRAASALLVTLALDAMPHAWAADQPVAGSLLRLADPDPSDPGRRRVVASARALASPSTVSGDPTTPPTSSGAVLQVVVTGGTPSAQTFTLPQGTAATGQPFWRALRPAGFLYTDRDGEHGPVRALRIRRSTRGTFQLAATLRGGALQVVPPNPGGEAFLLLTLGAGDRYCVRFGGAGAIRRNDARAFTVRDAAAGGCPALVSGELLALSYNVAGLPEGLSGSHPAVNTPIIAPLLNGYDLVVMQETWKTPDPNPLAPLRVYHEILEAGSLHPFKSVSAPLPLGNDPRRPTAFVSDGLNQFARFPFADVVRVMWDQCHPSAADCLSLKGFSMARTTLAPGVTVDVYDLHGEAGSEPEDFVLRDADVTQLSAFIQATSAGRPVIVGGDFNLHTDAEPDRTQFLRLLAETGLVDVCAALACPEPGRIDKFLFRSNDRVTIAPLSWRFETDVFVDGAGDPLSDHEALAVRFAWSVAGD